MPFVPIEAIASSMAYRYPELNPLLPSIRLVRLFAGTRDNQLRCQLTLSYIDSGDDYQAVSYFWGTVGSAARSATASTRILLDDQYVSVTRKVYHILSTLRIHDQDRLLWIDQLCIDQNNNEEKAIQVSRMRSIFQNARGVLVVLSDGTQNDDHVYRSALHVISRRPKFRMKSFVKISLQLDMSDLEQAQLLHLLRDSWFSRIWVIQEVAFAKNIQIVYSGESFDGRNLAKLCSIATQNSLSPALLRRLQDLRNFFDAMLRGTELSKTARLLDNMQRFRSWQATDPRDKVYALLGLSTDGSRIEANYNIGVSTLYISLAKTILDYDQDLELLSYCCLTRGEQDKSRVPSWCPHWGTDDRYPRTTAVRAQSFQDRLIYDLSSEPTLRVRGYRIATIQSVFADHSIEVIGTDLTHDMQSSGSWAQFSRCLKALSEAMWSEASSSLQAGDVVCILRGASGLAILRPRESLESGLQLWYHVWLQAGSFEPLPSDWKYPTLAHEINDRLHKAMGRVPETRVNATVDHEVFELS